MLKIYFDYFIRIAGSKIIFWFGREIRRVYKELKLLII